MAAVLIAAGAPVQAQLLKLTGDVPPPAPGTGADSIAMANALDRSITDIRARGHGPGVDAAVGLRRIARDLAREGDKAGAPGSFRVLMARTIANDLAGLDEVLLRGKVDEAVLVMVAANVSEESPMAARFTSATPAELDRLMRDALAPLMDATGTVPGPWGWVDDPPKPPEKAAALGPDIDRWSAIPGVTPEAVTALRELDKTLAEADKWAAYRRSGAVVRAEVRAAAAALPGPTAQMWLAPEARAQLSRDFSDAAVGLTAQGASMDEARAEMRRLGAAGRAAAGVDRLNSDAGGKKVRTALSDFLRNRTPDREAERRALDAFERALAGILARSDFGESRGLVRHLRPAWKVLDKSCQATEKAVVEALPRLLQFGDAVTDPAVLTAVASQRRALDDLRSLYTVSALLLKPRAAGPAPAVPLDPSRPQAPDAPQPASPSRDTEPAAGWKPVADRLLKLAQLLNKPDEHDEALEQLRAFSSRLVRFAELPGEAEFRASSGGSFSPPGWAAVTGNRAAELPSAIATARDGWLQAFAKGGAATDSGRLELLEELMRQLSAAAAVQAAVQAGGAPADVKGRGAVGPWPGWELTSRAQAALINPARDGLAKATALVLTGSDGPAGEALATARKQFPALLLFGRLERRAAVLGLGSGSGPQAAVAELGAGAPIGDEAWLAGQREELAHICRYVEEFSSTMQPSNPADPAAKAEDIRKTFMDFANSRATRVLDELNRSSG